jgi:L-methionine (R)-S-oxide reductase
VIDAVRQQLAQEEDRASTAKGIAEAIRASGHYRWVGIYQVNLDTGVVSNIGWSGPGPPSHPSSPITKGVTSRAIASKKMVNIGDVASEDYLTALATTRSEIIIPVLDGRGDRVLGTIDVESERPNASPAQTDSRLGFFNRHFEGAPIALLLRSSDVLHYRLRFAAGSDVTLSGIVIAAQPLGNV